MTAKAGTLPAPNVSSQALDFISDADGRRTIMKRTLTYNDGRPPLIEESRVLWSDWLPLMEESRRNGAVQMRKFFQWGADLSGALDGAGGIGGLLAITEENATGIVQRTLLPVQDGLGNIMLFSARRCVLFCA
jgi:hypothetical protein